MTHLESVRQSLGYPIKRYIILSDGETFNHIHDCVIYDSETDDLFTVKKGEFIAHGRTSPDYQKGITNIKEWEAP
jgi:hypothetical protein